MTQAQGPTVRRRIVASELKRLRLDAGLKQNAVAEAVGIEAPALSRYEQARSSMTVHTAERLFEHYGIDGDRLASLLELVRGSRKRGWMKGFTGVIPEWLEGLIALERDASKLHELAIKVIPGLLQTRDYAVALMGSGLRKSSTEVAADTRISRARIFQQEHPPEYWGIICESALRCIVGDNDIMRAQFQHLIAMSQEQNITIQVLPFSAGPHPSVEAPFLMLRFDLAPQYGVVYMDYLTGSIYKDDPAEIDIYESAFRRLIEAAHPEASTVPILEQIVKELAA